MTDFECIYGNEKAVSNLRNAVKYGRIANCYLISGERGLGKRTLAKAFAKSIQCEAGADKPCGVCSSCIQVENEDHPDVIYIHHEKPETISVDDIRYGLNETILYRPYKSSKKLYIIDEGELLNIQAQNAMLKTIEEPPEYAVIIILTTNRDVILPTIQSRSVELGMEPVSDEAVKACLVQRGISAGGELEEAMAFAAGNIGKTMAYVQDEDYRRFVQECKEAFFGLKDAKAVDLKEAAEKLCAYKGKQEAVVSVFRRMLADMYTYKCKSSPRHEMSDAYKLKDMARLYRFDQLPGVLRSMEAFLGRCRVNVNRELAMQEMLSNMTPRN